MFTTQQFHFYAYKNVAIRFYCVVIKASNGCINL